MKTAQIILQQLGGNKFIAITGVRNLACDEKSLSMKLSRNMSKATHMIVTLTSLDLYDVKFVSCRNYSINTVKEYTGVYADMLQSIFTDVTGLDTHL